MTPKVRLLVGWSVGRSVTILLKSGKLHFHAPIGALGKHSVSYTQTTKHMIYVQYVILNCM